MGRLLARFRGYERDERDVSGTVRDNLGVMGAGSVGVEVGVGVEGRSVGVRDLFRGAHMAGK